ncbi:MAG: alpha-amylase [Anaerolineae bacterium]|nr:alpha-amylase [Anaerolineae bacterium]
MEEFIFGTLATDELRMFYHQVERQGLHHLHRTRPADPAPDEPIVVIAVAGPDLTAEHVACYYTTDGSQPSGSRGIADNGSVLLLSQVDTLWNTLLWGYLAVWEGTLPPQPEGTVIRYRIGAWAEGQPETFADWPDIIASTEAAAEAFFRNRPTDNLASGDPFEGTTFVCHVDRLGPPAWSREAIIYHVFVDRFYPGDGRDWYQTSDVRDFMGGTLWGVLDKIEYIASLGINCLWLSPVFPSPSPHGYDATDLTCVDERLGGDEALRTLIGEAHARGIRVLLDLVCNHVSSQHPIFIDAQANPASPYRSWFLFNDSETGYRTFFGTPTMPQINTANDGARRWLLDAARYWLREFDADGYRLDHAQGPGLDFWADFWAACKDAQPESLCFGEVVDKASMVRHYVGRLDGCLDFMTSDALRSTYGRHTWNEADFERFFERHRSFFPETFIMPTFLDNHDLDRFLFIAEGNKERLKRAMERQMQLPNPPIIYYGTEAGLSQDEGTDGPLGLQASRKSMLWGDAQDRELIEFYQAQILARRDRINLTTQLPGVLHCSHK